MDEEEVSGPSGVGCRPGECFHGRYVWRHSNLSVCTSMASRAVFLWRLTGGRQRGSEEWVYTIRGEKGTKLDSPIWFKWLFRCLCLIASFLLDNLSVSRCACSKLSLLTTQGAFHLAVVESQPRMDLIHQALLVWSGFRLFSSAMYFGKYWPASVPAEPQHPCFSSVHGVLIVAADSIDSVILSESKTILK